MVQGRSSSRLAGEPVCAIRVLSEFAAKKLDRDATVESRIFGEKNLSHASAADHLDQTVMVRKNFLILAGQNLRHCRSRVRVRSHPFSFADVYRRTRTRILIKRLETIVQSHTVPDLIRRFIHKRQT